MVHYPSLIDTDTTLPPIKDGQPLTASPVEKLRQTIIDMQKELGIKPSGIYSTVKARFDALESIIGNLQIISLTNDLGGTITQPKVVGLQGRPISPTAPTAGQALTWNGIAWIPNNVSGGGSSLPDFDQPYDYLRAMPDPPFSKPTDIYAEGVDSNYIWVANWGSPNVQKINKSVDPAVITNYTLSNVDGNYHIAGLTSGGNNWIVVAGGSGDDLNNNAIIQILNGNTGAVIGKINPIDPDVDSAVYGWVESMVVDSNMLYITTTDRKIKSYQLTSVIAAFPSAGTALSVNDIADSSDLAGPNNYRLHAANEQLFMVTGNSCNLYEINQTTLAPIQTYSGFVTTNNYTLDITYSNGKLFVATVNYNDTSIPFDNVVYNFTPDSLSSGPDGYVGLTHSVYRLISNNTNDFIYAKNNQGHISFIYIADINSDPTAAYVGYDTKVMGSSQDGYSGIVFDGTNLWAVVFGENIVIKIDSTRAVVLKYIYGGLILKYNKGDVAFDDPVSKSNLRAFRQSLSPIGNDFIGITNLSSDSSGITTGANGNYATILGGDQNSISSTYGSFNTIVAGLKNAISDTENTGTFNFIGGGYNNSMQGANYASIVGGNNNFVNEGQNSFIGGGLSNSVNDNSAAVLMGNNNSAGSQLSSILGGQGNTTQAESSTILGGIENITYGKSSVACGAQGQANNVAQFTIGAGKFFNSGDAQWSRYLVKGQATGNTPLILTDYDGGQFKTENNKVYAIRATLLCNRTDNVGISMISYVLLLSCDNSGTMSIIHQTTDTTFANGQTYSVAFTTNDPFHWLVATFTGTVGHTVRALLTYEFSELGSATA